MVNEMDIITNSGIHPNLDIIYSGPIPPNPNELILSARLSLLVNKMKEKYDFILIDAPPVGIVSDALIMNYLADATMFVVRSGLTRKAHLEIIEDINKREKLPRPFIVLNAVRLDRPGGYREGFGASYGKGYGYYRKDKTNIFGRLKLTFKEHNGAIHKKGAENPNGIVAENGIHKSEIINT
jgi:Mrp family chromosome partitioning ATPase